jgi:hypothetical protein
MFIANPNLDTLRQGDIVSGLFYPIMKCNGLQVFGTINDKDDVDFERMRFTPTRVGRKYGMDLLHATLDVFRCYSIILSQCCDLELHNGALAGPAFVIAPLISEPTLIHNNPQELERFRLNEYESFVNLFSITQHPPLLKPFAVDFGRIVSVVNKDYQLALSGKILQMNDESRVRLKIKLGRHFARPTEEEIENHIYPR